MTAEPKGEGLKCSASSKLFGCGLLCLERFDLKKKVFLLAVLVLLIAAFLSGFLSLAYGQQPVTSISSVAPESVSLSGVQQVTVSVNGTIETANGPFEVSFRDANNNVVATTTGTADGYNVAASFTFVPFPGRYNVTLQDMNLTKQVTYEKPFSVVATGTAAIPLATALIMLIAVSISLMNMGLNRLIITKMIGWHQYRSMQKEISEYNSQRMAALRAKDTKTLEKLKKKQSQITAMQAKTSKPQLLLLPITFIYFIIWPVLIGYFPFNVAYVPGFGAQPFFMWYLICSFFFGTIASRVVGVTPIQ